MSKLDDELNSWDYPWLLAMDEAMVLCLNHLDEARQAQRGLILGLHLKMASRALRAALEVYGMRLKKEDISGKEPVRSDVKD